MEPNTLNPNIDLEAYALVTVEDIVRLTGLKKSTVYGWAYPKGRQKPPFPALRFGRSVRFYRRDVFEWLKTAHVNLHQNV